MACMLKLTHNDKGHKWEMLEIKLSDTCYYESCLQNEENEEMKCYFSRFFGRAKASAKRARGESGKVYVSRLPPTRLSRILLARFALAFARLKNARRSCPFFTQAKDTAKIDTD